jgi:hypothetical protein
LGQKADCVGRRGEDKTARVDVHDVYDGTGKERDLIHDAQDSVPSTPRKKPCDSCNERLQGRASSEGTCPPPGGTSIQEGTSK